MISTTIIWELSLLIAEFSLCTRQSSGRFWVILVQTQWNPGCTRLGSEVKPPVSNHSSGSAPSLVFPRVSSCWTWWNRVLADENKHSSTVSLCCGTPERDVAFPADIWAGRSKTDPNWKYSWIRTVLMWFWQPLGTWKCEESGGAWAEWWYLTGLGCPWRDSGQTKVSLQWKTR